MGKTIRNRFMRARRVCAGVAGVSLSSIKRIAEEVPVVHVDDAAERGGIQCGICHMFVAVTGKVAIIL